MPPPMMTKSYESCKSVSRPIILAFFAVGDAKVTINKNGRNEKPESIFASDINEKEMKGDITPRCSALEGKGNGWQHSRESGSFFEDLWVHLPTVAPRTSRRLQKRRNLLPYSNKYADTLSHPPIVL